MSGGVSGDLAHGKEKTGRNPQKKHQRRTSPKKPAVGDVHGMGHQRGLCIGHPNQRDPGKLPPKSLLTGEQLMYGR